MTPERWRQIEDLYHAALARDGAERGAFVAGACGSDRDLEREVTSLLARASRADSFLERPTPLRCGQRFGAYEIEALIGAGGMGEVYRARDTKLGRAVAIKVLPETFTRDPERRARFDREARVLAALNHPHIGAIYGVEDVDGVRALVLELVDGETLDARLNARAPTARTGARRFSRASGLELADALGIARQIVEALEAAHEHGIVHRDLKPANIKITPTGAAKVLDFGLAKLDTGDAAGPDPSQSPTLAAGGTRDGLLLGTAAYMSPEQARGQAVDKRADIWAFGCVLYEMLTRRAAFPGDTVSDTIAAILDREPDWRALPDTTPATIRTLLQRCLAKDSRERLRDIGDARIEIDHALREGQVPSDARLPHAHTRRGGRLLAEAAVAAVIVVAILGAAWALVLRRNEAVAVTHVQLTVAPADRFGPKGPVAAGGPRTNVAISPDGRTIVFVGQVGDERPMLFMRALERGTAVPLAGTQGARNPFPSPDGHWIGFWSDGYLRKVPVGGGPVEPICEVPDYVPMGASWGPSNEIVFARALGPVLRVPASGGTPATVTTLAPGELSHRLPHWLPDGRAFLFTVRKRDYTWGDEETALFSVADGTRTNLLAGADARYVRSGHLVFMRLGELMAVPFDVVKRRVIGTPIAVADNVGQSAGERDTNTASAAGQFAVSDTGVLVYARGGVPTFPPDKLGWVDRAGHVTEVPLPAGRYVAPRLSPDGRQVAIGIWETTRANVAIYDLERGSLRPFAADGEAMWPIWSPDGRDIVYQSFVNGTWTIKKRSADGTGSPTMLTTGGSATPASWSHDGQTLAYVQMGVQKASASEIWTWRADLGTRRLLGTPLSKHGGGAFSPTAPYLAFVGSETGENQVYVQPYIRPGSRIQVSTHGGDSVAWSRDGRELFYRVDVGLHRERLMAVAVMMSPTFRVGVPQPLFESAITHMFSTPTRSYDVAPDGKRFLTLLQPAPVPDHPVTNLEVVLNWTEELKRRVPTK